MEKLLRCSFTEHGGLLTCSFTLNWDAWWFAFFWILLRSRLCLACFNLLWINLCLCLWRVWASRLIQIFLSSILLIYRHILVWFLSWTISLIHDFSLLTHQDLFLTIKHLLWRLVSRLTKNLGSSTDAIAHTSIHLSHSISRFHMICLSNLAVTLPLKSRSFTHLISTVISKARFSIEKLIFISHLWSVSLPSFTKRMRHARLCDRRVVVVSFHLTVLIWFLTSC